MDNSLSYQSLLNQTELDATTMYFTGLTANQLIYANSNGNLASVSDLTAYVAGTTNQISVANNGNGTITLSTPQNTATTSSPTFAGLTLTGLSGVLKASAGVVAGSSTTTDLTEGSNLYYTNARSRSAVSVSDSKSNLTYNSSTGVFTNSATPSYSFLTTNGFLSNSDFEIRGIGSIGYVSGLDGGVNILSSSASGISTPSIQAIDSALGNTTICLNPAGGSIRLGTTLSGVLKASSGTVSGSATTSDLTEGSNLYYTDARARSALSVSDSNGNLTYNSSTGVFTNSTTPTYSSLTVSNNATVGYIPSSSGGIYLTKSATYGKPSVQSVTSGFGADVLSLNPVGGNVGVNSVSPQSKFVVCGSTADNQTIEFGYSGGLTSNYLESVNRNGGASVDMTYYISGSNNHRFFTNATEYMRIWSNGYVSVGNTLQYHNLSIGPNATFGISPIDTYYTDIQQNMYYGSSSWRNRAQGSCSLIETLGGSNIAGGINMYVGDSITSTAAGTAVVLSGALLSQTSQNPILTMTHGNWTTGKSNNIYFQTGDSYIQKHYDDGLIINDNNKITFKEATTTVLTIDGGIVAASGKLTATPQYGTIHFQSFSGTTTFITSTSWTKQTCFDQEESSGVDVTASHSNDKLTINTTGNYLVSYTIYGSFGGAGYSCQFGIYKNGTLVDKLRTGTNADVFTISFSMPVSLTATDYLELYGKCSNAGGAQVFNINMYAERIN